MVPLAYNDMWLGSPRIHILTISGGHILKKNEETSEPSRFHHPIFSWVVNHHHQNGTSPDSGRISNATRLPPCDVGMIRLKIHGRLFQAMKAIMGPINLGIPNAWLPFSSTTWRLSSLQVAAIWGAPDRFTEKFGFLGKLEKRWWKAILQIDYQISYWRWLSFVAHLTNGNGYQNDPKR